MDKRTEGIQEKEKRPCREDSTSAQHSSSTRPPARNRTPGDTPVHTLTVQPPRGVALNVQPACQSTRPPSHSRTSVNQIVFLSQARSEAQTPSHQLHLPDYWAAR